MTKRSLLTIGTIAMATLFATTSCKKSSNNGSSSGTTLTATVNGTAWKGSYAAAGVYTSLIGEFDIGASQVAAGDTTGLSVAFATPILLNTPVSSDSTLTSIIYLDYKTQATYIAEFNQGSALVTVTSYDTTAHKVAGTFSGVVYNQAGGDSLVITNGAFNSTYTSQ